MHHVIPDQRYENIANLAFSHPPPFFKQKTAYEINVGDWSSDVCSSDLLVNLRSQHQLFFPPQSVNDTNRLRNFMNQPDVSGIASFVAKCLAL